MSAFKLLLPLKEDIDGFCTSLVPARVCLQPLKELVQKWTKSTRLALGPLESSPDPWEVGEDSPVPGGTWRHRRDGRCGVAIPNISLPPCRHNLRFWNAAFFDAVHCERRKRSPTTR